MMNLDEDNSNDEHNQDNDGMSQAEIGKALGMPRQTVANIEERGLAKLRRLLVLEREAEATRQRGRP